MPSFVPGTRAGDRYNRGCFEMPGVQVAGAVTWY
jgi:hypothetical protein